MSSAPRWMAGGGTASSVLISLCSRGISLYDPDGYVAGPPNEAFERLRQEDPVHWQDMPDGTGYWAVLRHSELVRVARSPDLFSASLGGVMLEDLPEEQL